MQLKAYTSKKGIKNLKEMIQFKVDEAKRKKNKRNVTLKHFLFLAK